MMNKRAGQSSSLKAIRTPLRVYALLLIPLFLFSMRPIQIQAQNPDAKVSANYCSVPGKVVLTATGGDSYYWPYNGSVLGSIHVDIVGTYNVFVILGGDSTTATIEVSNEMVIDGSFTNFDASSPSFFTEYTQHQAYWDPTAPAYTTGLGPEGLYAVNVQAWYNNPASVNGYHPNFHGRDHTNNTVGPRNFMLVNGSTTLTPDPPNPDRQRIIWQQTVNIQPNTNYYFSAWGMNLNPSLPAQLQFEINDSLVGTIADLNSAPKPSSEGAVNTTNWVQFYSDPKWFSGALSGPVTIRIRNLNTASGGNDFGLDDISFGTLDATPATINPQAIVNPVCEGETINLQANVSGGKPPYSFEWTGPNGFTSTEENPDIANSTLANDGTYILVFNDGFGCGVQTDSTTVTVTAVTVYVTPVNILCFGNATGSVTATPAGGIEPYTYLWTTTDGTGLVADVQDQSALSAGTYIVTVTDANGCEDTESVTVGEPTVVVASALKTDASCNGGSDGTATASATGGTPDYTYSWNTSPVQTTAIATGLSAGTYIVTVTDANGCETTVDVTITEPETALSVSMSSVDVLCFGEASVSAIPVGGTAPYTYLWNDASGQTTATAIGLTTGTFGVTITDANGCTNGLASVTITEPEAALSVSISAVDVSCFGDASASASAIPAGGTEPYTYLWTTMDGSGLVDPNKDQSGLTAGTYVVTVTDANGCSSASASVIITQPAALSATTTQGNVLCVGGATGEIDLIVLNGNLPYTYAWTTKDGSDLIKTNED